TASSPGAASAPSSPTPSRTVPERAIRQYSTDAAASAAFSVVARERLEMEMKTTTLVLGVIAAATTAASIYLGAQLSAANEQLAQAGEARAHDAALIHELEADRSLLQAALENGGKIKPAAAPGSAPAPMANNQKPGASPLPAGGPPAGFDRQGKGSSTPAEQNVRRINQEVRLRRRYAGM